LYKKYSKNMKINANFLKYRSHFERMVRPARIEL
jgi:hypothetical protein